MLVWIKETYPMCKLVFATTTQSVRSEYEHEQIQKRNKKVLTLAEKLKICVDPLAKLDDTTSQFLTKPVLRQFRLHGKSWMRLVQRLKRPDMFRLQMTTHTSPAYSVIICAVW